MVHEDEGCILTDKNSVKTPLIHRLHHNHDEKIRDKESSRQLPDLNEFLSFRGSNDNTSREMVAQDMALSYNELFQATQQPQEFMSLEELSQRVHQDDHQSVSTSSTSAHLYLGGQNDQEPPQQHQQQPQQRTYYNLSALSE